MFQVAYGLASSGLLRACELLEPDCLVQMLKAIKHLSMNATLLDVLQNANALEVLIRILDEQSSGLHGTVYHYDVVFGNVQLSNALRCRKCPITSSKHATISVD